MSVIVVLCLSIVVLLLASPSAFAALNHILGIQLHDTVVLSASSKHGMGLISLKDDVENIRPIGCDCLVGFSGHNVLCDLLYNELDGLNRKKQLSYSQSLSVGEVIAYSRAILKRFRPMILQQEQEVLGLLIAGWEPHSHQEEDEEESDVDDAHDSRPVLYWMNEFGEVKQVPYAAHGPLSSSLLSYCDYTQLELQGKDPVHFPKGWQSLTRENAEEKVENVWNVVQKRSNIVMNRVTTKWLSRPVQSVDEVE